MIGKKEELIDDSEIEKIKDRLDEGETVVKHLTQSRVGISASSLYSPSTIFATEKRIIIRLPTKMGLGENIEEYFYNQITNVKLEKGMFYSSLLFAIPGMTEMSKARRGIMRSRASGVIESLPKKPAEDFYNFVREKIAEAKKQEQNPAAPGDGLADPMKLLKTRFVKGEITKEEFEDMKQTLE